MLMISLLEIDRKKQHSHAHSLLRECLKPYGIDYSENTPVTKNKYGKPSLTEHPEINYNISHADGVAACIVSERVCGIDCERIKAYRPKIMPRVFDDSETAMVESLSGYDRDMMFFRLWTLKEAFVKAVGQGISYPMKEVVFSFDGDNISCSVSGYDFRQYIIRNEYIVSVAVRCR